MDPSIKPLMRVLCAEPLEGRWLLSAAAQPSPAQPDAPPTVTVTLGEFEQVGTEEEDGDVAISPSQLPTNVLDAFNARFGGATIEEVELEEDDERGTEYGITAEHGGREVEVTISPAGEIVETETFIEPDELPPEVVEQIRKEFGDAEIIEAAALGGDKYEVMLTATDGLQYEGEATRIETSAPPTTTPPPVDDQPTQAPAPAPTQFAGAADGIASEPADASATAAAQPSPEQVAVAQASAAATDADAQSREDAIEKNARAKDAAATTFPVGGDRVAEALDALAAGKGASVWLPEVAGALVNVLPIDFKAIEQSVQDVLRQVGTLTAPRGASPITTGATRVAMAATLVAAVKVLLNQSRKSAQKRPALVFGPGTSSWGWVLGTSDAQRRRRRRVPSTPK
jgi:hypothetical protein